VKETVAAFEKRTGLRYAPAAELRALARPLARREACPTLFRYPGPEGLRDFLSGSLRRLAPRGRAGVWLSSDPRGRAGQPQAVRLFGTVAVLQPLRLSPCAAAEKGTYLGANPPARGLEGLAWVAPSLLSARVPWDRLRTARDLLRHIGSGPDAERGRVLEQLDRYLEELAQLRRAGAPGLEKPWCELPASARRELLDRYGIQQAWTAA
jgi:hypothetical protein